MLAHALSIYFVQPSRHSIAFLPEKAAREAQAKRPERQDPTLQPMHAALGREPAEPEENLPPGKYALLLAMSGKD
jgi:hypothetical protein